MTFGMTVLDTDGDVQVNVVNSIYECVYSGTVAGSQRVYGLQAEDILGLTYIGGSYTPHWRQAFRYAGGAYQHSYANNYTFFGSHRLVVFRPTSASSRTGESFGVNIYDAQGLITFSSDSFPLLINNDATYRSLIFQGNSSAIGRAHGNNNDFYFTIYSTFITQGGGVQRATMDGGIWWDQFIPTGFSADIPPIIADVTFIPYNFSKGGIYLGAGVDLQPGTNPNN